MNISRRDLLRAAAALAAAPGLRSSAALALERALSGEEGVPVVWLQGQSCSGCSVSLLNSIYYTTADDLLLNTIDLKFHPTVMAAAGDSAATAAESARASGGYVLVIEGAIPTGAEGRYCELWPGMSMHQALVTYAPGASWILAVGTCAAFGGMSAGSPNPTTASSVAAVLGGDSRVINIPGCPAHPDWIVGTIAYLLAYGHAPPLDASRRPTAYFSNKIHDYCPERRKYCGDKREASRLSQPGCLEKLGCRGKQTYADCYMRKWNGGQPNTFGANWCIGARTPCHGCVQPNFPDGMSPFFREDD